MIQYPDHSPTTFNPIIDPISSVMKIIRHVFTGSLNTNIPTNTVHTVPIPVQTVYAVPIGIVCAAFISKPRLHAMAMTNAVYQP